MHTNFNQINQTRQIAEQLIQQTQQGSQQYQMMLQQEQQNVHLLEQMLQREKQAVQTIEQSLHSHQQAIHRCQEIVNMCNQMQQDISRGSQVSGFQGTFQPGFQQQSFMQQPSQFQSNFGGQSGFHQQ